MDRAAQPPPRLGGPSRSQARVDLAGALGLAAARVGAASSPRRRRRVHVPHPFLGRGGPRPRPRPLPPPPRESGGFPAHAGSWAPAGLDLGVGAGAAPGVRGRGWGEGGRRRRARTRTPDNTVGALWRPAGPAETGRGPTHRVPGGGGTGFGRLLFQGLKTFQAKPDVPIGLASTEGGVS